MLIYKNSHAHLFAPHTSELLIESDACIVAHKESGVTQGGKFATVQLDVSDRNQIATLWDKVPADLRDVDILG